MDPNANLEEQREIARRILEAQDGKRALTVEQMVDDAERLAELVLALDGWMSSGGFVPERWTGKRK